MCARNKFEGPVFQEITLGARVFIDRVPHWILYVLYRYTRLYRFKPYRTNKTDIVIIIIIIFTSVWSLYLNPRT